MFYLVLRSTSETQNQNRISRVNKVFSPVQKIQDG